MRHLRASAAVAFVAVLIAAGCGGPGTQPSPPPGNNPPPPPPVNTAPQIKSITLSETRAEVGVPLTLTASVDDLETPAANLTYTWTADTGTFSGTGQIVTWVAGQDAKTPADVVITLAVTERYTSGSLQIENKVTSTTTVHLNNSPKELQELSLRFLSDFANSKVSAETCVNEFSTTTSRCANGKRDELEDIRDNRHDYEMTASTLRHTGLTIAPDKLSATVHTFCSFTVKVISPNPVDEPCQGGRCPIGSTGTSTGDCWTTNVYEQGRWWLCESRFSSVPTLTSPSTFVPMLFRNRGF